MVNKSHKKLNKSTSSNSSSSISTSYNSSSIVLSKSTSSNSSSIVLSKSTSSKSTSSKSTSNYIKNDIAYYNGSLYIALIPNINIVPSSNILVWDILARAFL
jgi:hypothetical protein